MVSFAYTCYLLLGSFPLLYLFIAIFYGLSYFFQFVQLRLTFKNILQALSLITHMVFILLGTQLK